MPLEVHNAEGLEFLQSVDSSSVNLVLTDPPYIISRESGMNSHYNQEIGRASCRERV